MKLIRGFIFTASFFILSCSKRSESIDVVGTYVGHYGGGIEIFEIRPDGKFTQVATVSGRKTYENKGRWFFDSEENEVTLIPFAQCLDATGNLNLSKSPEILDSTVCDWSDNPGQLLFYIDDGYLAIRRSAPPRGDPLKK